MENADQTSMYLFPVTLLDLIKDWLFCYFRCPDHTGDTGHGVVTPQQTSMNIENERGGGVKKDINTDLEVEGNKKNQKKIRNHKVM